ncbi:hypothetical protein [Ralstonia mannitolilytica]|uniref:hypothetical protein n=1 Tax=Ralstonia mannitolilytica TaxID=105219 RepID=UPI0007B00959|nr:hypothetical protein [Ralstonia mannitolilytica]ANA34461.1 hypothetical protein VZ52_14270 [Ralstonia mannitolilytica]
MARNLDVQTPGGNPEDDSKPAADTQTPEQTAPRADTAGRVNYAELFSYEVDAKKLRAPVLCKDGWLAPDESDRELPTNRR